MAYEVDLKGLRKAMVDKDLNTIEDMCVASGINRNTVSDVLHGRAYPSSSVMARMGTALGLSGDEMGRIFFKEKLASGARQ